MMEMLRQAADDGSLVGKSFQGGEGAHQKSYEVHVMDDYSYTDPIDGSVAKKQVMTDVLKLKMCFRPNEVVRK